MIEVSDKGRFTIDLPSVDAATALSGPGNSSLKKFESLTGVCFTIRGLQLEMSGVISKLEKASALVELTRPIWEQGIEVPEVDLKAALSSLNMGQAASHAELGKKVLARLKGGKYLRPRTIRQKAYVDAMENFDLVFAIGPAGTGKTFLATVLAARFLNEKKIGKIILTRPAVEAGENLGFLPGDLLQKVDPYLKPLYDSLHSIFGIEKTNSLIDKGIIEVAPLAYMRGRTLENAIVILDEAQNTTSSQMKMFLTRLGERSKMIVNGDISQIDLKNEEESGLINALKIFSNIDGIKICYLNIQDVVRHPLVQKIISAYE
tara:strand:- start:19447 stop:20403 length:957 start_codon:yes stop_codon:yes gene_type:complete